MTIRRRLILSFGAILALFALNLVVYSWGNQRRTATVESLRRAVQRQLLIASVQQKFGALRKQVELFEQVTPDLTKSGVDEETIRQFELQLRDAERVLQQLQDLAEPAELRALQDFSQSF